MLALSIIAWIAVTIVTIPSAWRLVRGRPQDHDAIKFSYFLISVVVLGFSIRWVVAPDEHFFLEVMRLLNTCLALFLLIMVRFYKDGR